MSLPALGMLEVTGIARGMVVCDALVKRAQVELLRSAPVDPGKYNILFCGQVAEVEEAMEAGEEAAANMLLDGLLLPHAHRALVPGLRGQFDAIRGVEAVAIVETHTLARTVESVDKALKTAEVTLLGMRLGRRLGGKGFYVLTGELYDIEAAVEMAMRIAGEDTLSEIIARPHPDFIEGALRDLGPTY